MKPCTPIRKLSEDSLKEKFSICNCYNFRTLLIVFFLSVSVLSVAGNHTNYSNLSSTANNYSSALKAGASSLTGIESIRSNLYLLNADNTTLLADGVLTEYSNSYHDSVYLEDAYKFTNFTENLGLTRYGSVLSIERRPLILIADTLFFKLWKTTRRNYQFEFITNDLDHPGLQAFLEDAYLGTSTFVALSGITKINFYINTDVASANVNRFRIVYKTILPPVAALPLNFIAVKGYPVNNKISVNWQVENEINIEKYIVERSSNGIDFFTVFAMAVSGLNNHYNNYYWLDTNPGSGNNFYRISCMDRDHSIKYSIIVKVINTKAGEGSITIYPNPIKNNLLNLRFTNLQPGIYQVRLINNNGQQMYSGKLALSNSNIPHTILINKKLREGIYQLEITAPGNTVYTQKALVE